MERNYDEIIADMLIQLDVHTQELTNQSRALEKQSRDSSAMHAELVGQIKIMEKMDGRLMDQLDHSSW